MVPSGSFRRIWLLMSMAGMGGAQAQDYEKWPPPGSNALTRVHPGWDLAQARPSAFNPRVSGMDWLPDGRLVVSTWSDPGTPGEVFALSGVTGNDPEAIGVEKLATGLKEPLGLAVAKGSIYVLDRENLKKLAFGSDGKVTVTPEGAAYAAKGSHPFNYGLLFRNDRFYFLFGGYSGPATGGGNAVSQGPDGSREYLASGFRNPNGLGFGPDGELFATDNQGEWLPANKLIHVKRGGFYGYKPSFPQLGQVESPPAVYIPQGEAGLSPSQPLYADKGPYAGQMLIGDVRYGNVHRVFFEKMAAANGDSVFQGALFHFTAGLEAGINRMTWGPDGALYLGGIGAQIGRNCCWSWNGKAAGLQKMKPNGKVVFEMLAVRSKRHGFELEFTKPLGAGADSSANYKIWMWSYAPTASYGGPKVGLVALPVKSTKASLDRKRMFLAVDGLKENKVVWIQLSGGARSETGEVPWTTEAWYTLNVLGPDQAASLHPGPPLREEKGAAVLSRENQGWRLPLAGFGRARVEILDLRGKLRETIPAGRLGEGHRLAYPGFTPGIYMLSIKPGSRASGSQASMRKMVLQ